MPDHPESIASCQACGNPMDVSAMAPFSNVACPICGELTRVKCEFGPYTLVRRHAVGGMSMVFAARDHTLDREVAVKILSEGFSANERRIAAFEEEARITASFSHPNVVRVLKTGRAFGYFYIAMEFVPGGHFEQKIRDQGKIPELEMLPLAIEVAQGLKAAHAAGLIHRDVKPGNILLDAMGHAKLVDFGLALVTQGGKAQATEIWATPYYVPPETVEGYTEDFRSDIYAFGATLYHALSGKPSCGEESMATHVLREAKKRVVPLHVADPSISVETCRIVERAMAYNPNDRFRSYDEMIATLSSVLRHLKSGRPGIAESAMLRRTAKKRQERIIVVAGVLAVVLVSGIVLSRMNRPQPEITVVTAPPDEILPPPVMPDTSVEIMKSYREARAAVETKDFEKAARKFIMLHKDPAVQEPTRSWAGVEAVLAAFLDGRTSDARKQARATLNHLRSLAHNSKELGDECIATLEALGQLPPLAPPKPDFAATGASGVIVCMLAGLKNWEQGMLDQAVAWFTLADAVTLPANDQWAAIYQGLARDHLADYQILSGPLFASLPTDSAGCETARSQLETVPGRLKTRGRAQFNVRALRLDLARQAKLLGTAKPVSPDPP